MAPNTRAETERMANSVAIATVSENSTASEVMTLLGHHMDICGKILANESMDRLTKVRETMLLQELIKAYFKRAMQLGIV
jgi:dihydroxyacetone kinase-like predicted kinase